MVPLVSMPISKPCACSAAISGVVQLQQRLAAGADDIGLPPRLRPLRRTARASAARIRELAAAGPVGADEIGVAEFAHRLRAVPLQPAPQIAAGKAQEHRGPAGVRALALQRVIDFLDPVGHAAVPIYFAIALRAQIAGRADAAAIAPIVAVPRSPS